MISFRNDLFDLLQSKGLPRVFSSTTIRKHQFFAFFMVQLSHPYMTAGKTIALTLSTKGPENKVLMMSNLHCSLLKRSWKSKLMGPTKTIELSQSRSFRRHHSKCINPRCFQRTTRILVPMKPLLSRSLWYYLTFISPVRSGIEAFLHFPILTSAMTPAWLYWTWQILF